MSDHLDEALLIASPDEIQLWSQLYSTTPASPPPAQYQSVALAPAPSVEDILASVEQQLRRAPPTLGHYAHHPPDIVSVAYTGITPPN